MTLGGAHVALEAAAMLGRQRTAPEAAASVEAVLAAAEACAGVLLVRDLLIAVTVCKNASALSALAAAAAWLLPAAMTACNDAAVAGAAESWW